MSKNITVAVLDGEVDSSHPLLVSSSLTKYHAGETGWKIIEYNVQPTGHGTAVAGILVKNAPSVDLVCFDVLSEELTADLNRLIGALLFIRDHLNCQFIHMSLGLTIPDQALYDVCRDISSRGVTLVSAFDNAGAISYPAAYPFVIGVDASPRCFRADDFVFVENSPVNVRAKGGNQRVAWVNPAYTINQGASFAAPYVTAYLMNLYREGVETAAFLPEIRRRARFVYENDSCSLPKDIRFSPRSAVAFPFNKEIHSLLNYSDLLTFDLVAVYDIKHSGNIGLKISSLDGYRDWAVENIDDCQWDRIDSMVIGHLTDVEALTQQKWKNIILEKCLEHRINVYCFDSIGMEDYQEKFQAAGLQLVYPHCCQSVFNKLGKLYHVGSPVLGIFGTTSKQGKYTLQLQLRRRFLRSGYQLQQMGTEPSAPLFGMDTIYPFGFNADASLEFKEAVEYVNYLMHRMDQEETDMILVGSQSGTLPLLYNNLGQITDQQLAFLMGTRPDAVILCVNIEDPLSYILRTIAGIESISEGRVIACSLYPFSYQDGWGMIRQKKKKADPQLINRVKQEIQKATGLNTYVVGEEEQADQLYEEIIDFFT